MLCMNCRIRKISDVFTPNHPYYFIYLSFFGKDSIQITFLSYHPANKPGLETYRLTTFVQKPVKPL